MSRSDAPRYDLTIEAGPHEVLTLFDGYGEQIAREAGRIECTLPRGLYTVRTEFTDRTHEQVIRLDGSKTVQAHLSETYTVAPLRGSRTSHEYYRYPAIDVSRQPTRPPLHADPDARLMIVVRCVDKDKFRGERLADGLSLRSNTNEVLSRFEADQVLDDRGAGMVAFSADLLAGTYRLRHADARELAVPVFPRRTTIVFILFAGELLFDGGVSISSAAIGTGFDPDSAELAAIELGLWSLQNGETAFPRAQREALFAGRFDDPLFALIGGHVSVEREQTTPAGIAALIGNLEARGYGSADLQALAIRAATRWPDAAFALDPTPVAAPPLLRVSLDALIAASAESADLIPGGSVVETAALHRYADSPLTTWRPPADAPARVIEALATRGGESAGLLQSLRRKFAMAVPALGPAIDADEDLDWVDHGILDALRCLVKKKDAKTLTSAEIARSLRLPRSTVESRLAILRRAADAPIFRDYLRKSRKANVVDLLRLVR